MIIKNFIVNKEQITCPRVSLAQVYSDIDN